MTKELDEKLVAKYPKIFADRHGNMMETCMCWGFSCGDGWYWLIDNLCSTIQSYLDSNKHLNHPQVVASQVKEKFGTLRFYTNGACELINGMIWLAEHLSGHICEECGDIGEVQNIHGWYECRCPKHSRLESIKDEDIQEDEGEAWSEV
jgi:hypothetical protein